MHNKKALSSLNMTRKYALYAVTSNTCSKNSWCPTQIAMQNSKINKYIMKIYMLKFFSWVSSMFMIPNFRLFADHSRDLSKLFISKLSRSSKLFDVSMPSLTRHRKKFYKFLDKTSVNAQLVVPLLCLPNIVSELCGYLRDLL